MHIKFVHTCLISEAKVSKRMNELEEEKEKYICPKGRKSNIIIFCRMNGKVLKLAS